jgi:hypothetical protein
MSQTLRQMFGGFTKEQVEERNRRIVCGAVLNRNLGTGGGGESRPALQSVIGRNECEGEGPVRTVARSRSSDRPARPLPKSSYNRDIVRAFFAHEGIPIPLFEFKFHPYRKWRFDLAWPDRKLALEVQGGIFSQGRHTRGAAMLKEWEKLNSAACLGWRVLYCQPSDLCMISTTTMIQTALKP